MIFTSSFPISGKNPRAVAISRGVPVWFRKRPVCEPLRPSRAMLKLDEADFTAAYGAQLAALDPHQVAAELGEGAVLLCWERSHLECHRMMVADWLRAAGYAVEELPPFEEPRLF